MADPVIWVQHGDDTFKLRHLMASEFSQVKKWTGIASHHDFFDKVMEGDPDAVLAAFTLHAQRQRKAAGDDTTVRLGDVDVDLTAIKSYWYDGADDDARRIRMVFETNSDGTVKTKKVRNDRGGQDEIPVPLRESGEIVWEYVDSGERVPPTGSAETSSPATTQTAGESSGSDSGTPLTAVS